MQLPRLPVGADAIPIEEPKRGIAGLLHLGQQRPLPAIGAGELAIVPVSIRNVSVPTRLPNRTCSSTISACVRIGKSGQDDKPPSNQLENAGLWRSVVCRECCGHAVESCWSWPGSSRKSSDHEFDPIIVACPGNSLSGSNRVIGIARSAVLRAEDFGDGQPQDL